MSKRTELFVVVRHVYERSLPLCLTALAKQTNAFMTIYETPFLKAVTKTFEEGIKSKARFLLAMDGDVILKPNAIKEIMERGEKALASDPNLFKLDFQVQDKFMGNIFAGCHLYVNRHTPRFLEYFRQLLYDPRDNRPESHHIRFLRNQLGLSGVSDHGSPVGFHDYEQYYQHLYVKFYNRAVKGGAYVVDKRIPGGNKRMALEEIKGRLEAAQDDKDYAVALAGLKDGVGKEFVLSDASSFFEINWLLDLLNIQEKEPIRAEDAGEYLSINNIR